MCEIEPQLNFMRENRSQLKCFFFQVYQIKSGYTSVEMQGRI